MQEWIKSAIHTQILLYLEVGAGVNNNINASPAPTYFDQSNLVWYVYNGKNMNDFSIFTNKNIN